MLVFEKLKKGSPAASKAPAPLRRLPAPPALFARTAALLPIAIAPTASALRMQ